MKPSESKLALAKVINENGGWVDDSANWAVQPKREDGDIWFSSSDNKPYRNEGKDGFTFDGRGLWIDDVIKHNKLHQNWHQCVLSREEYYQAYPKADADGWVEWNGGECPVDGESIVEVELNAGDLMSGAASGFSWMHEWEYSNIVKYRLCKPDVNPEFCESVTRSIPHSDDIATLGFASNRNEFADGKINTGEFCGMTKPTIEQLAQDYRNAKDYAVRLQKEAGDAAVKAEALAVEIRKKILELQELIG